MVRRAWSRWRAWWPWAASSAAHAAAVAVGVAVVWGRPAPEPEPADVAADFWAPDIGSPDAPADASEPAREPERLDGPKEPARDADSLPAPPAIATPSLAEVLRSGSASPDAPVAEPDPTAAARLAMDKSRPEARFYGVGAGDARRVVYVVDASGSMVSTFPLLRRELARSLSRLGPTQMFQVVFFQGDPSTGAARAVSAPHPDEPGRTRQTRLIRATRANIDRTTAWLDTLRPAGRSNPLPALELALALEPEAVFVLSSPITGAGEWEIGKDEAVARLDALNPHDGRTGRRGVLIKAIQFLEEDPSGVLREIGEEHGGPGGVVLITRDELR